MRCFCILNLLAYADGDQQSHKEELGGDVTASEVSIILLKIGPAEKGLFTTYINAYLTNKNPFNCTPNVGFCHCFSLSQDKLFSKLGSAMYHYVIQLL